MIRVNCRYNVHITNASMRVFLQKGTPFYAGNVSLRLTHTNRGSLVVKAIDKRYGVKSHYRDGSNAVSKLRNAAIKRSTPITDVVVNARPRKGLIAKRASVDELQGKVNAMQPRRSFTAIAIRDHLMRLKKMATPMFQALGKATASSSKDKEEDSDFAGDKIERYIKIQNPTKLEDATFTLAQEISASIQNDLMPLDKKTRAMLSYYRRSDTRMGHHENTGKTMEFDNTPDDELTSAGLNSNPLFFSNTRSRINVIEQLGNVPQQVPSTHVMKISPILVGRRLNDIYLSTTKESHNRYNYAPLPGNFGSPRRYKIFQNVSFGHSPMSIQY